MRILAVLLLLTLPAQAADYSFFLEPGAGLTIGGFEQKRQSDALGINTKEETNALGPGFFARAGMYYGNLFTALDWTGGPLSYDPNDNRKGSSSWMYLGLNFGFEAPDFPLRIWGGYGFMSRYEIVNDPGTTRLYKGNTLKFGTGIKFRPFSKANPRISLNIEYAIHNLSSARGVDGTHEEKDFPIDSGNPAITFSEPTVNLWLISISVPFEFGGPRAERKTPE